MSKKIKIIISILALISIAISSFLIFNFFTKNNLKNDISLESQSEAPSCDDIKYLSFTLPSGSPVESNYQGVVANISKDLKIFEDVDDDTEIQLVFIRVSDDLRIEYTIMGDVLVEMGDPVEKGTILGRVKDGGLKAYKGANLIIWAYDKDNNAISLSE